VYDPRAELHRMPWRTAYDRLIAYPVPMVVISGGEPLGQQARLVPLVRALTTAGRRIEIETNGTVAPHADLVAAGVRFNVSPKLSHAGDRESRRLRPAALSALAAVPGTAFKFVCRTPADLDEVASLVAAYGIRPVWIMPEGRTRDELSKGLITLGDDAVARGWNLTTRLHVAVWGDRRGI
jgi:organic radical activating enzyme